MLKLVSGRGTDEDRRILDAEVGLGALDTVWAKLLPTTAKTTVSLRSMFRNRELECGWMLFI